MASTSDQLRSTRDYLLRTTDWTQVSDITLENWEEWVAYRQALRDLPANTEDPTHPEWPEPPQVKIVPGKNTRTQLTETKSALETTRADLTTQLDEERAKLRDTQTELAKTKSDLQAVIEQNQKLEARLAFLESALIS